MAHYQNPYGVQSGTDEYGNPIRQTDEYGNVIPESGQFVDPLRRTGELRDTDPYGVGDPAGRTAGTGGQTQQHRGGDQGQGMFHHDSQRAATTGYTAAEQGGGREKKGMMEKIKEKLPGAHH
ncbi:dehydrin DHN1-like [Momordica charantia]|uniref:Dehydrin DHN1-like n=1 Tax=Momordica charantia TaxID=3673 RepID=A0A6J1C526_MOMCH|nr:dehydrin DHN1-like [Momordica charantia]